MTDLPFDGEISRFFRQDAPDAVRHEIKESGKGEVHSTDYPYSDRWDKGDYKDALRACQIELVKLQHWLRESGERIALVFEGRDAAGKGGMIKRFRSYLNPRSARVVALPKPTETEASGISSAMSRICRRGANSCSSTAPGTIGGWWKRCSTSAATRNARIGSPRSIRSRKCWWMKGSR